MGAALVPDTRLVDCISRHHFQIEFELESSEVYFQNLGSAGTILNGSLLLHRDRVSIRHSLVTSGAVQIAVPRPQVAGEGPPILEFQLRPHPDARAPPLPGTSDTAPPLAHAAAAGTSAAPR